MTAKPSANEFNVIVIGSGMGGMIPGIAGALSGGLFGAAAIDSRVFKKLRYAI